MKRGVQLFIAVLYVMDKIWDPPTLVNRQDCVACPYHRTPLNKKEWTSDMGLNIISLKSISLKKPCDKDCSLSTAFIRKSRKHNITGLLGRERRDSRRAQGHRGVAGPAAA
jgi:hypothetical protein